MTNVGYSHLPLKRQNKYQNIFEHMPIGIIYIDTSGVVTDCNLFACDIFSRSKEEFIGLSLLSKLQDEKLKQAIRDVLSYGNSIYDAYYYPINGAAPLYLHITLQAIYNDAGIITAAVGLVKNVHEEKYVRHLLKHYKQVLDTMTDMIVYIDNTYCYLLANRAYLEFHHKKESDILNKNIAHTIGKENFHKIKPLLDRSLQGEKFTVQGTYTDPNTQATFLEEGEFAPYINEHGETVGVAVTIRHYPT